LNFLICTHGCPQLVAPEGRARFFSVCHSNEQIFSSLERESFLSPDSPEKSTLPRFSFIFLDPSGDLSPASTLLSRVCRGTVSSFLHSVPTPGHGRIPLFPCFPSFFYAVKTGLCKPRWCLAGQIVKFSYGSFPCHVQQEGRVVEGSRRPICP